MRQWCMADSKKLPQNSIGITNGVLKNDIGTLKGMLGTIGGPLIKPSELRTVPQSVTPKTV